MASTEPAQLSAALRAPFPPEAVGKLPRVTCPDCRDRRCDKHKPGRCEGCGQWITTAHIHLDYVGHAHVTERLLDVDPAWSWEPMAITPDGLPRFDDAGGLWIRLTVGGITRLGYGDAGGKRGPDAVKEAIGDGIRNAAMRSGVALDLWKKEPAGRTDPAVDRQQRTSQAKPAPEASGRPAGNASKSDTSEAMKKYRDAGWWAGFLSVKGLDVEDLYMGAVDVEADESSLPAMNDETTDEEAYEAIVSWVAGLPAQKQVALHHRLVALAKTRAAEAARTEEDKTSDTD